MFHCTEYLLNISQNIEYQPSSYMYCNIFVFSFFLFVVVVCLFVVVFFFGGGGKNNKIAKHKWRITQIKETTFSLQNIQ